MSEHTRHRGGSACREAAQGAPPAAAPEAATTSVDASGSAQVGATAEATPAPAPVAEPLPPPPPVGAPPPVATAHHVNFAVDDGIHRQGFTLQLSLGIGALTVFEAEATEVALGGLNLELGGFITEDIAIVAKFVGVNPGFFGSDVENDIGVAGGFGVAGQFWLGDNIALTGGLGYALLSWLSSDREDKRGFAPLLGFNWFPIALKRHGLGLAVEITPGFVKYATFLAYQAGFAWQYY